LLLSETAQRLIMDVQGDKMRRTCRRAVPVFAVFSLLGSALPAQGLAGVWQGTLREGPRPLRMKFDIARNNDGQFAATLWSIDEAGFDASYHTDTVALSGRSLLLTLTPFHMDGARKGSAARARARDVEHGVARFVGTSPALRQR
jgi:hypothetical protein